MPLTCSICKEATEGEGLRDSLWTTPNRPRQACCGLVSPKACLYPPRKDTMATTHHGHLLVA